MNTMGEIERSLQGIVFLEREDKTTGRVRKVAVWAERHCRVADYYLPSEP